MAKTISVAPSARRLTTSLRDIGYSFESAVADLVDNSVAAGATQIVISTAFDGKASTLVLADNGVGMSTDALDEAMRFGSRRNYDTGELGRYGLGLKTASLSQARRLEVVTRAESDRNSLHGRALDLDFIQAVDDWSVLDISEDDEATAAGEYLGAGTGTVVTWRKLDRILSVKSPEGGWARRRVEALEPKLSSYLSMVFHRFLSGEASPSITISVNGNNLEPWDPFARAEPATRELTSDQFEIEHDDATGTVTLRRFLLPTQEEFSSRESFNAASGIEKWNKQQGLYIYRADRLVQWGGWAGIRTLDEHTKSARASLDFNTDLDEAFNINVAKMRVSIPSQLRKMMARPVNELCIEADAAYRRNIRTQSVNSEDEAPLGHRPDSSGESIGLALRTAAARTGQMSALTAIAELIKQEMPDLAAHLGFE